MLRRCLGLALALITGAASAEALLVAVRVNDVDRGTQRAWLEAGQLWLASDDVRQLGLKLDGQSAEFDGVRYLQLSSFKDVRSHYDPDQLTVSLTVAPAQIGEQTISLYGRSQPAEVWRGGVSGYLNYTVSTFRNPDGSDGYGFAPLANLSAGGWNLRSDQNYQSSGREERWQRVTTTATHDWPDSMARLTLGDLSPVTGTLGSAPQLAGIGFSRVFSMQQDFDSAPSMSATVPVTTPSTAEVYLNGERIRTESLSPGMYQFQDLRYFAGLQNVQIVLRDEYGNRQTINVPYYFDDSLLKAGLNDFNYNVGVWRRPEGFDDYGGFAYSLYHRYGVSDALTVGARAEGNPDYDSAGGLVTARLGRAGVLSGAFSWARHDDGNAGDAQYLAYRFDERSWSLRGFAQHIDPGYVAAGTGFAPPRWSGGAGGSWGAPAWGNWSLDWSRQVGGALPTQNQYRLGYSVAPLRSVSLSMNVTLADTGDNTSLGGYVNLAWFFDSRTTASVSSQRSNDGNWQSNVALARSTPFGEGWGYRVNAQHGDSGDEVDGSIDGRFAPGQLSLSASRNEGQSTAWRASWAGALVYADGATALSRQVNQSFAIAELPLSGVAVTQNGQVVGRSGADGRVVLPDLSSYNTQQIGLVQNDLPLDYAVPQLRRDVQPGYNSGRVVRFEATPIRAWAGVLVDGQDKPLSSTVIRLALPEGTRKLQTALDGSFYVDDLAAGEYRFIVTDAEALRCRGTLVLPAGNEVVQQLAPVRCTGES
ncbi:fimbria/pilus outer membrane usher protein [Jeongeupia naejangsanensis]|uniref:Fimbrial biogenesis outer membrane usher protein n=1 Tax=Jeongeupia naejangsanensis TaxID=613195 RepID=A0ABS2BIB2_9NEIS|nr:fimbria/pilus outer membrane usher protein [Jeongeupia naejangsanensis]MBM3115347.1 fimbrial biogenesis outer membrane usher protein [Jeongeupia naejangsanensis]